MAKDSLKGNSCKVTKDEVCSYLLILSLNKQFQMHNSISFKNINFNKYYHLHKKYLKSILIIQIQCCYICRIVCVPPNYHSSV